MSLVILNRIINLLPINALKSISRLQWRFPWMRKAYISAARFYSSRVGVVQRGAAKGLRFDVGPAVRFGFLAGCYEPEVQHLYSSLIKPNMVVYDVGANTGFLAILAARCVGPGGRVVCFEPMKANAATIERNARLNGFSNIVVIPAALGIREGPSEFQVSEAPGWGRLKGTGGIPAGFKGTIMVDVTKLSTAVDDYELPLPDVVKVDIEGGEVDMLEGSTALLSRCRPLLLIELHGTNSGVERILREARYDCYVLGNPQNILEASWDAFVVAAPQEDREKCMVVSGLAARASHSR